VLGFCHDVCFIPLELVLAAYCAVTCLSLNAICCPIMHV